MNVYIRVRPYSEREISQNMSTHSTVRIDSDNPKMITLLEPSRDFRPLATYSFARCFWSVFSTSSDVTENQSMSFMRDAVDTYVNNAAISSTRIRPRPLSSPAPYHGSGSNATIVDGGITHPPYANQADIFEYVGRPILNNVLEGYNGCVFAYGQTGSGKTFTMMGFAPSLGEVKRRRGSHATADTSQVLSGSTTPRHLASCVSQNDFCEERLVSPVSLGLVGEADDGLEDVVNKTGMDGNDVQGIIPRIAAELFSGLRSKREKDASCSYRVEVSYYEIYNERVFDLIKPQRNSELKIRHNRTTGPYVEGLTSKIVSQEEDIARVLRKGIQERHTAQTMFNDRSSRSHSILSFSVVQLFLDTSDGTCKMQSKLNLVDLAGSERAGAAGVDRPEYEEGVKINLSLTVLGRVIDCLADLSQNKSLSVPVPYRDSNLTWLLMDSIGGNSQTSMIATISPHMINYDEMRQTIRYASRAKQIVNRAVINEDPQVWQIKLLTGEVERLQQLLKESGASEYTTDYVKGLEKRIRQLEKRAADQDRVIAGLRAELERAGLQDPTLAEEYTESILPTRLKAELVMQKKLEKAQVEAANLRSELEAREATGPPVIKKLKQQVVDLERENKCAKEELRHVMALQVMPERAQTDIDAAMRLVEEKETIFFQICADVVADVGNNLNGTLRLLQQEHDEDFAELKKFHQREMEEAAQQALIRMQDSIEDALRHEQILTDKHTIATTQWEENLQRTRNFYEEKCRRTQEDRDAIRRQAAEFQVKVREQHQQELGQLRCRLEETAERQRAEDGARHMQETQARELERRTEEFDRAKRISDAEIARLNFQLKNEALQRQSDLMEKDRQKCALENEMSDLRREKVKLEAEKCKVERSCQERVGELMLQQGNLMNVCSNLLSDWQNQPQNLEASMDKLRGLINDPDYLNFRQKIREMAFVERTDIAKEMQIVEDRARRDAETIRSIVTKARQAKEEQDRSLLRFQEALETHHRIRHPGLRTPTTDVAVQRGNTLEAQKVVQYS